MPISIDDLLSDLAAETAVLHACLEDLGEDGWETSTPADRWTVKDQIGHLAFFDQSVTVAVLDPDRFRADREDAMRGVGSFVDALTEANRGRTGGETDAWFRSAREAMVDAFGRGDPAARVPWYGPDMSLGSALTARIMETWAHGQDVYDGLGLSHPITPALRQVAHIGVRALPNSYRANGRAIPDESVRVELIVAGDEPWAWGPVDAVDRVSGPAVDFCLVVTQRRHVADTRLSIVGAVATEWMSIAQAFAGPVGAGRSPGQFPMPDSP